jgi:hypothetical protein
MSRGSVFVPKMFADAQPKLGGSVPVAKIFLPQFSAALPIRLTANGSGSRRVAEARLRRPT